MAEAQDVQRHQPLALQHQRPKPLRGRPTKGHASQHGWSTRGLLHRGAHCHLASPLALPTMRRPVSKIRSRRPPPPRARSRSAAWARGGRTARRSRWPCRRRTRRCRRAPPPPGAAPRHPRHPGRRPRHQRRRWLPRRRRRHRSRPRRWRRPRRRRRLRRGPNGWPAPMHPRCSRPRRPQAARLHPATSQQLREPPTPCERPPCGTRPSPRATPRRSARAGRRRRGVSVRLGGDAESVL
mmetsp:Transcript_35900/g.114964  ORF Transcript_35900/g.114964 Transcript_35900/m.114964 type:complete len:239 (+) Transcript_35900:653-1369(+)